MDALETTGWTTTGEAATDPALELDEAGPGAVEHWAYELESPFRPPHEILQLAEDPYGEAPVESGVERWQEAPAESGVERWQEAALYASFLGDAESADVALAGEQEVTLRRGSRGAEVRRLQQALQAAGHTVQVDGAFGAGTEAAVRAHQAARGLTVDGVVGPSTWATLAPGGGPVPPAPVPSPAPFPAPTPAPSTGPTGAPAGVPTDPLGTLVVDVPGRPRFSYRFTPEDLTWTAKLLVHEAGGNEDANNAAVLWAMFNRYALFTHRVFPTFTAFIRAYSTTLQPVLRNPRAAARHVNSPQFVRMGGFYPNTTIPRGQLQRHLDIQRAPWNQVKASARRLALRALRGELANPGIGNASDFASTRIFYRQHHSGQEPTPDQWRRYTIDYATRSRRRWIGDVPGLDQMKNAFFLDRRAITLPAGAVRVVPPSGGAGEAAEEAFTGLEEWEQYEDEASSMEDLDWAAEAQDGAAGRFQGWAAPAEELLEDEAAIFAETTGSAFEADAFGADRRFEEEVAFEDELSLEDEEVLEDEDALWEANGARSSGAQELYAPGSLDEWSGGALEMLDEVDRRSAAYARWVQESLNRVIGAGLVVDGVAGTRTRDAVRRFQSGRGLRADGVVGAETERALVAAGASAPPGSAAAAPATPSVPVTSGAPAPRATAPAPSPAPVGAPATAAGGGASPIPIPVPPPCVQVPTITAPNRPAAGVDPRQFAGLAEVAAFAGQLADCYATRMAKTRARERHAKRQQKVERNERARRVPGESSRDRTSRIAAARAAVVPESVEAVRTDIRRKYLEFLESDFADTIRGGANRWKQGTLNGIARQWMFGQRERVDFVSLRTDGAPLRGFAPPPAPPGGDQLVPIESPGTTSGDALVQPLLNQYLRELRRRHLNHRASTYPSHGGGTFNNRGYSIDLFLPGGTDDRGFWPRPAAVRFLLAMDETARAMNVEWRAIYNDYAVAAAVNRHTGRQNVIFVGQPRRGGRRIGLNWHGPLILHFHLDIAPKR